jgi:hypothetical protein
MVRIVADAKLFSDDRRDALGGPNFPDEAEGFRTSGKQTGKLCELLGGQPGRGAGRWLAIQGFDAPLARPLQPLADAPWLTPRASAMVLPVQPR